MVIFLRYASISQPQFWLLTYLVIHQIASWSKCPLYRINKTSESLELTTRRLKYPHQPRIHRRERMPRSPPLGRLIVGIDVGTTHLAIATAEVPYGPKTTKSQRASQPLVFDEWIASFEGSGLAYPLTALYYEPGNALPLTGNSLEAIRYRPEFDSERLIRLLKLQFHDHNNDPVVVAAQARVQGQLNQINKTADEALADFAKVILNQLLDSPSGLRQQYDHFDRLDLEIVITVPPGRSTVDHARVRQAFTQGTITSTQVFLESEPAAMFRSWVNVGKDTRDWVVGRIYLICDAGGGTCCFVRLRLERVKPKLGFRQEYPSKSVPWGGESISDAFELLAESKVPCNWDKREDEIRLLRDRFDNRWKCHFGADLERKLTTTFQKSGRRDEYWEFSFDEIASCFDPCIDKLIDGLKQQIKLGTPPDFLILGGGLASNHYVLHRIRNHFKGLRIRELGKDKKHVVVGAVLSRIENDFLVDYPVTRSKGVITLLPLTNEIKASKVFPYLNCEKGKSDGGWYFYAVEWLVKQGTQGAQVRKIASECCKEDARIYDVDPNSIAPEFSEEILTFDYDPGQDLWAAELEDGSFKNINGEAIPRPEFTEEISWSPWTHKTQTNGVTVDDLEWGLDHIHKILRCSIEMEATELSTLARAKVWSSKKSKTDKNVVAFYSKPVSQKPMFTSQNISSTLAESFSLERNASSVFQPRKVSRHTKMPLELAAGRIQAPSTLRPSTLASAARETLTTLSTRYPVPENGKGIEGLDSLPQSQQAFSGNRLSDPKSSISSAIEKPTQNPSISGGFQCAPGTPRGNGGCWICASRNSKCPGGKPRCTECAKHGLKCEYGCPDWWYDSRLRQRQIQRNKDLIRANCSRVIPQDHQQTPATSSFAAINNTNSSRNHENPSISLVGPLLGRFPQSSTQKRPSDSQSALLSQDLEVVTQPVKRLCLGPEGAATERSEHGHRQRSDSVSSSQDAA